MGQVRQEIDGAAGAGRAEAPARTVDVDLRPGEVQIDPNRTPHHLFDAPLSEDDLRFSSRKAYEKWRAKYLARVYGESATAMVKPRHDPPVILDVPDGVRLVRDLYGFLWTDVYGAAILAGVSRRTIYMWTRRGWIGIRYTASGKLEVRVDSLWWRAEERAQAEAQAARATPVEGMPVEVLEDVLADGDDEIDTE